MRRLAVREYDRIARADLGPRLLRRLQRFDQACAAVNGQTIFDWSRAEAVRVHNYAGIVQVPGLVIEILPKLTSAAATTHSDADAAAAERQLAQGNLLYMLSVAGEIPFE